ncbi:MAG: GIY-YIG nuclease family protein [Candidatus Magasanikbacteria bacterium]|nr:GIY-YIG nuclease family protein [Candidatus Magasanikbacteria bacterium]
MYYVYILRSKKDQSCYIGSTENLKRRLQEHNSGNANFTSHHMPYVLAWYCVFHEKNKAIEFERYLKQGSGFAFTKKRLI